TGREIIIPQGYLLLKAAISRKLGNWISKFLNEYDYMDFQVGMNIQLQASSNNPKTLRRHPKLPTLMKYYNKKIIRKGFLAFYLELYKTQIELKILASMMGFKFIPYEKDVLGLFYFDNKGHDMTQKIKILENILNDDSHSVLMGRGQSHWMVVHALSTPEEKSGYFINVNDPMGRSLVVPVSKLDNSFIFYFFKFDKKISEDNLNFLKETLHL
ncbi:MAG: hypothetical protein ACTSXU_00340, partial [Promethearchaeota archaeon]